MAASRVVDATVWRSIESIAKYIGEFVSFGANAVTLFLGLVAVWAFFVHRGKVNTLVRVLLNSFLNERVKRTKETLGKLESLNYDSKEDRPEVFALLGQVSGQIKPLTASNPELAAINEEVRTLLDKKIRLNEATKRRLLFEVHAALDNVSHAETRAILETKND